jgi:phage terminase large subunit
MNLGIFFQIVPRVQTEVRGEVEEGIHNARMLFAKCWFDAELCKKGVEALQHYHYDYNQRIRELTGKPVHDWASHAADAFRGLATRYYRPKAKKAAVVPQRDHDPYDTRHQTRRVGRGGYR